MLHTLSTLTVVSMLVLGFSATSVAQQPRDAASTQRVDSLDDTRDSTNWGWVGLAGLIGLAGMRRQSHDRPLARSEAGHSATAR